MKRTAAALILASLALSGCGLRPLYSGGSKGAVAQSLGQVEIAPIPGKAGWLVRNAIADRLGTVSQSGAVYRLEVELDDQITGFGVRRDDSVTRERRSLRARYRLVEADKGTVVLDATAGSDAGIDIVSSEYATIAAENTALENLSQVIADQIVTRLALYAQRTKDAPPAGKP
ncbi:LPS assembly lipoprotein LptE [Sphingopyxis sp.]|uniref:LPS assembly lipoprotein LptE n=1 Tax=Sphingopyxis sp. TaxID=1908224 RepID=UPI002EDA3FF7